MTYFLQAASAAPAEWPDLQLFLRREGRQAFPVANLVYLQATTNYTWIHWANGKRVLMARTLKYYEPQLPDALFIRLHRNCIVNRRFIDRIEVKAEGCSIYLTTGDKFAISRRRWPSVHKLLADGFHLN